MNWFDNICAKSRSKFMAIKEPESKVHMELSDDLISASECYKLIKRNMKRSENEEGADIFWKIPIILTSLACVLIILMAFSFVCQCLEMKLKNYKIAEHFGSDNGQAEKQEKAKIKVCSCLKDKSKA